MVEPASIHTVSVRPATGTDVDAIAQLVVRFALRGDLLPRSIESIRLSIDSWVVGELDGAIAGIGSLLVYTPRLAEVRSLAVDDSAQGTGLGRMIVQELIQMGRQRDIPQLFALTRVVPFFEKFGFRVTEKENFPEKIWHACRLCPIQDNCDEIAVVLSLHN